MAPKSFAGKSAFRLAREKIQRDRSA